MAKKRASMREGPLADLFRATGDAHVAEEVEVTATATATEAEVAVADEEIRVERVQVEVERREREPATGEHDLASVEVEDAEAGEEEREQPVAEVVEPAAPEPAAREMMLEPHKDPAVEEVERRETRALRVNEEAEVEHEGLQRLLGSTEDERPAFGRDEPDTARYGTVPRTHQAVLRVVGVGGAGVNAINRMVEAGVPGVEFVAINTDLQSLQNSGADTTLHIGAELTRGLGSGSDPRVGYRAAFEEQDKIKQLLKGSDMVFLAAGAGGGTGTGAAPVVAKLARDVGALTVAAVTKPFGFEGARRAAQAEEGIAALGAEVDTLIVVPNERLLQILERRTSITDAFRVADDVLRQAVQGISDLVMLPGLINLDFADVRTTMLEAGDAILGIGMGVGEHRAMLAAEKAVSSPLLDSSVEGAHSLLLSITGGPDLSLIEASEAAAIVQQAAHPDANIIFGASIDEDMSEEVWITVIATRFDSPFARRHHRDSQSGPSEPRPRVDDERSDRRDRERRGGGRDFGYADPVGDWRTDGGRVSDWRTDGGRVSDWRTDGDRVSRGSRQAAAGDRLASADEIYGEGIRGRGQDRRPTHPSDTRGGLVLDVPEFIPGH